MFLAAQTLACLTCVDLKVEQVEPNTYIRVGQSRKVMESTMEYIKQSTAKASLFVL